MAKKRPKQKRASSPRLGHGRQEAKAHAALQDKIYTLVEGLSSQMDRRLRRNIAEAVIGLMAGRCARLTVIGHRGKRRCKKLIYEVKRLSRLLRSQGWQKEEIEQARLEMVRDQIKKSTAIGIDLSTKQWKYAWKVEDVATVWDAKEKKKIRGHWWLMATAKIKRHRLVPLIGQIFSHTSKGFVSMNKEKEKFLKHLKQLVSGAGIWLFDRGFDSKWMVRLLGELQVRFIMRIKSNRDVEVQKEREAGLEEKGRIYLETLLRAASYPWEMVKWVKKKEVRLKVGFCAVKIPGLPHRLWLVYTKGGEEFTILTNLPVRKFSAALRVLRLYGWRWGVEELF